MTNNLFDRISINLRSWLKNFRKISIDTDFRYHMFSMHSTLTGSVGRSTNQ